MKAAILLVLLVAHTTCTFAGDLEKARLLYQSRLLEDAKRELVDIVTSDASTSENAAALHLLGTIAIDEKRYESAVQTWSDLIARYPGTKYAEEAKERLPFAQALRDKTTSQSGSSTPVADMTNSITVVGIGTEAEFVNQTVTEFMNLLASKGVSVVRAPAGISSVPELLRQNGSNGKKSVLVLALRFGYMENLRAMCYEENGQLVWEEKASGSMGFTKSGITQGLIERVSKKIEPHIGETCLPTR